MMNVVKAEPGSTHLASSSEVSSRRCLKKNLAEARTVAGTD